LLSFFLALLFFLSSSDLFLFADYALMPGIGADIVVVPEVPVNILTPLLQPTPVNAPGDLNLEFDRLPDVFLI
jgi:hypothetical protein